MDLEYVTEKRASAIDFEDRKIELKESLMCDLEEKKRMIEMERTSVELTNDSTDPKPVTTRKLRRRPNDPVPIPEKRKRGSPDILFLAKVYNVFILLYVDVFSLTQSHRS